MNHLIYDIKLKGKINSELIELLFNKIVNQINLRVLRRQKHIFSNWWFTIFYLLAESHISAHYRIEDDYLALDIYSCNDLLMLEKDIKNLLSNNLPVSNLKMVALERNI